MVVLLRSNDLILISRVEAMMASVGIACFVADRYISALEGSIGAFPQRVLVPAEDQMAARRHLIDAGLGAELAERTP